MKYLPNSVQRLGHMQLLKLQKNSPTLMVVSGVVGLGVTAVMAAHATRKLDPILEDHQKARFDLEEVALTGQISHREDQRQLVVLYSKTTVELAKLYAPTIAVGTLSAASVLYGHKVLKGRHMATMAAYSGLLEQFRSYRARVAETIGADMERDIHNGAVGVWEEDPNHPGEKKRVAKFVEQDQDFLRPFFDETNVNWNKDPVANYLFLKGVQSHMNNQLETHGYILLSEVYKALGMRDKITPECVITGWLYKGIPGAKDGFIDLGFMTDDDPNTVAFRNGFERVVRLNFNIDGVIWNLIP